MPPADLRVCPVTDGESHRQFCDFPYDLYRSDPFWVPPLRSEERRRWSPWHNASLRRRWCRRFLARRGPAVVGRVAAVIDEEFARRWSAGAGFFGFFECADDDAAARALLTAAEVALCAEGRARLIGPVNVTTHDEVGLLGVLPEATGAGIAPLLAHHAAEAARRLGIRRAELSLVHADNRRVRHVIEAFAGKGIKTYRLYEKAISSENP